MASACCKAHRVYIQHKFYTDIGTSIIIVIIVAVSTTLAVGAVDVVNIVINTVVMLKVFTKISSGISNVLFLLLLSS